MQVQFSEDKAQASLIGEFTFNDHGAFKDMVSALVQGSGSSITIDLSKLQFIDSAGLGMLLLVRDEATKRARKLILRSPTGQVKRMFGLTKFDALFAVEE